MEKISYGPSRATNYKVLFKTWTKQLPMNYLTQEDRTHNILDKSKFFGLRTTKSTSYMLVVVIDRRNSF